MIPTVTLSLTDYDNLKKLDETNKNLNLKVQELQEKIDMLKLEACDREILKIILSDSNKNWLMKKALCHMFIEAEFKKYNIDINTALHIKWNKDCSSVTYSINKIN